MKKYFIGGMAVFMMAFSVPAHAALDATACENYKVDLVIHKEIYRHNSMLIKKLDQSSGKYALENEKLIDVKSTIKELKPLVKACKGR